MGHSTYSEPPAAGRLRSESAAGLPKFRVIFPLSGEYHVERGHRLWLVKSAQKVSDKRGHSQPNADTEAT